MSAVRRPSAHRDYIRQVAKQTVILKLQGKSQDSFLQPKLTLMQDFCSSALSPELKKQSVSSSNLKLGFATPSDSSSLISPLLLE